MPESTFNRKISQMLAAKKRTWRTAIRAQRRVVRDLERQLREARKKLANLEAR